MPSKKDCLDDIARRTGRPHGEVNDIAQEVFDRAKQYEDEGLGVGDAYQRARDELLSEMSESYSLLRRAEIMDVKKDIARHRYYKTVADQIAGYLDKVSPRLAQKLRMQAPRIAMEAKLVGVNMPFLKNRLSVDAQYIALRRLWVGGFSRDLEKQKLLKIFATRAIEDHWTDELFELNKGAPAIPV